MSENVYGPIAVGVFIALFGWELFRGFRSGTMGYYSFGNAFTGNRKTEPTKFWFAAVLNGFFFTLGLIGFAAMLLWPDGVQNLPN